MLKMICLRESCIDCPWTVCVLDPPLIIKVEPRGTPHGRRIRSKEETKNMEFPYPPEKDL